MRFINLQFQQRLANDVIFVTTFTILTVVFLIYQVVCAHI